MITQELAKQLAVKIGKKHGGLWTCMAILHANHHQTVIADKEALRVAFRGGE